MFVIFLQPLMDVQVMNGCSDLFHQVFGEERGKHVRTSIGTSVLSLMAPVEIDAIFEVKD